jgi:mycothiol system anti-sigma-R factor
MARECDDGADCDQTIATLYTYLDGELTIEVRTTIATHLDRCGSCGGAAHFEAELRAVIADCARARVPEPLLERIRAVLAEEARSG